MQTRVRKNKPRSEIVAEVEVLNGRHKADLMRMECPETGAPIMVARVKDADVLDEWMSKGLITAPQAMGGADFRSQFHRARLAGRYGSVRLDSSRGGGPGGVADIIDCDASAYKSIKSALDRLGPMMANCVWFLIGEGYTIKEFALRCSARGQSMPPERARGLLLGALDILAIHYGHASRMAAK